MLISCRCILQTRASACHMPDTLEAPCAAVLDEPVSIYTVQVLLRIFRGAEHTLLSGNNLSLLLDVL